MELFTKLIKLIRDATSSASKGVTSRSEHLEQLRSRCATELEFEIESSKEHWTELDSETSLGRAELVAANREVFERLMKQFRCPETGECFFHDWGESLTLGAKIAEGGQAEIFEAEIRGEDGSLHDEIVVKAFKSCYSLEDLERQWPRGMFRAPVGNLKWNSGISRNPDKFSTHFIHENCCFIHGGTLLKNGRFGFVLERYWGDLRKFIDLRRRGSEKQVFRDPRVVRHIMLEIAKGMLKLHKHGILHRDLKASNVLVQLHEPEVSHNLKTFHGFQQGYNLKYIDVADFESSVGVVGTGFWRAPEVLCALKNHSLSPETWTEKCDVYSYGMTCYEVITGCIPFEDVEMNADNVINGARPRWPVPYGGGYDIRELVEKCWDSFPSSRPSFQHIVWKLNNEMQHQVKEMQLQLKGTDSPLHHFQHQLKEVKHQLEEVKHQLEEVEHQLKEVEHQLKEVKHQLKEVKHQLEEVKHQLEEVEHQLKEVEHQLEEVKHQLEEVEHQLKEVEHQSKEVQHRLKKVEHQLKEVQPGPK